MPKFVRARSLLGACLIFICLALFLPATVIDGATSSQMYSDPTCTIELGEWVPKTAIPEYHVEAAVQVVDGKLFVFGGFGDADFTPIQQIDVYDPITDTWELDGTRGIMPYGGSHAQSAVDGKYVWIVGGFLGAGKGTATANVWRYDTQLDQWWQGPSLPQARASGGVARVGRHLHYFGGLMNRNDDASEHWYLDIDNPVEWLPAAPVVPARNHFTGMTINGQIYAMGGQLNHDNSPQDLAIAQRYDPVTDEWYALDDLPYERSHVEPSTSLIGDRIVMVGGRDNTVPYDGMRFVTEYNPETDEWAELRQLPVALLAPVASRVGNYMVVTAGGTNWYTPQANTWVSEIIEDCIEEPQLPSTISMVSPVEPDTFSDGIVTFEWMPDTHTEWYNIYVAGVSSSTVINKWYEGEMVCGSVCQSPAFELAPGRYTWYARGWNELGYGEWNSGELFWTGVGFINQVSPSDDVEVDIARVDFVWEENPGATWYRLVVVGTETFDQWFEGSDVCSEATCTISEYFSNGDLDWWIQGWGPEGGFGEWGSESFSVNVAAPPAKIVTSTPTGEQTNAVLDFNWEPAPAATWYNIVVNGPEDFSLDKWYPAGDVCSSDSCTKPLSFYLNGDFTWSVRAYGSQGMGIMSDTLMFDLDMPAPQVVQHLTPANGATTSAGTVTLVWESQAEISWYRVYLQKGATVVNDSWYDGAVVCGVDSCSLTLNLTAGVYDWYMQSWGPDGEGVWNDGTDFTVNP